MKKMHIIAFRITLLISIANSTMSYGMETAKQKEKKEFQACFEEWLPKELQKHIVSLSFSDVIEFLGLYTITLEGHTDWVNSVAIAGDKVVTGSEDATAKVWDINNGQLLHTLDGHTDVIISVATAGDKVVTGSRDTTAKIWDINTGHLLDTLEHAWCVNAVAITGDIMATGSGNTLTVWNLKMMHYRTFLGHWHMIDSIAIAGNKVLTGSRDNTAKIWNINNGQLLLTLLVGHMHEISSVSVAGDKVVTGSVGGNAKIWDINTGQLIHTLQEHQEHTDDRLRSVAIEGNKVVTGLYKGNAKIWNSNTGSLLQYLHGHTDSAWSVAISGDKVVTGSRDTTAKIWSLLPNLHGTSQNNPLLWIVEEATIPQLDFINRAYKAAIDTKQDPMIIALPKKLGKVEENELQAQRDGRIYFTLPLLVRKYVRDRLNIWPTHLNIEPDQLNIEPTRGCFIQ